MSSNKKKTRKTRIDHNSRLKGSATSLTNRSATKSSTSNTLTGCRAPGCNLLHKRLFITIEREIQNKCFNRKTTLH
uniref:Uncharacterized protein n=1 Tax=Daphnia magna TaxID=35525 RepID=A0A0P6BRT8_9CRUS